MREIQFRGVTRENNKTIFGYYWKSKPFTEERHYIRINHSESIEVILESVGQYIGKEDKEGKKIFEGDICQHENGKLYEVKYGVFSESVNQDEYSNTCFGFHLDTDELEDYQQIHNSHKIKVVGNTYCNKDLLATNGE